MSDLPAPLTPADCDLRGFMEWSRFFGERAFNSRWYRAALKDARGGLAALKLWWTAMLEQPAGSLPNDEDELCWMADFGQDMRAWRKHRATAMYGFVLCADNRWYHPFLAEEAIAAWERRRDREHERTVWREQKRRQRGNGTDGNGNDVQVDNGECPDGQAGGHEAMSAGRPGGPSGMSAGMSASRGAKEGEEKRLEEKKDASRTPYPTADALGNRAGRVNGNNPREKGTNPRAVGTNPRATRYRNGFHTVDQAPGPVTIDATAEEVADFRAFHSGMRRVADG